ncbi:hypothetical protein B0H16DRAFT_1480619 [Mycena metata]|uniref:Uncharacterized protein n=1 Tax=Mycena metata TaxID=1033252 RepID=A0AAD7MD34_9AGAR|nr:hypothetical protein B0H16DRAFT_1480619 [Mycena metata]
MCSVLDLRLGNSASTSHPREWIRGGQNLHSVRVGQSDRPTGDANVTPGEPERVGSPELFEGYELNNIGDPDFPLGIIIDITAPMPVGCLSAVEEIHLFEELRRRRGDRALTALEYDANLRWLQRFRTYPDPDPDAEMREWSDNWTREILEDPVRGSRAHANAILDEIRQGQIDERRIAERRPYTAWTVGPEQIKVLGQLGDWGPVHEDHLRVMDRHGQAVVTQGLRRRIDAWFARIAAERSNTATPMEALTLWDQAYTSTSVMAGEVSWSMNMLQAVYARKEARASVEATRAIDAGLRSRTHQPGNPTSLVSGFNDHLPGAQTLGQTVADFSSRFSRSPLQFPLLPRAVRRESGVIIAGQENLGLVPADEACYWVESESFSNRDINRLTSLPITFLRNTATGPATRMTDAEDYDLHNPGAHSWAQELERLRHTWQAGQPAFRPSNMEDDDYPQPGANPDPRDSFQFYRSARVINDLEDISERNPEVTDLDCAGSGPLVLESFAVSTEPITVPENHSVGPQPTDELILRSVRMTGPRNGEQLRTMVDCHGNVYWVAEALPIDHYLHPEFRAAHERALQVALTEIRAERADPSFTGEELTSHHDPAVPSRGRHGVLDEEPRLFPGTMYHDVLAKRDPEEDDLDAPPGARVDDQGSIHSDRATQGSVNTKPRRVTTIEEIYDEEDENQLPTLPGDSKVALEKEEDIGVGLDTEESIKRPNRAEAREEPFHQDKDPGIDSEDEPYYDAPEEPEDDCPDCARETAEYDTLINQGPVLHVDLDCVAEVVRPNTVREMEHHQILPHTP